MRIALPGMWALLGTLLAGAAVAEEHEHAVIRTLILPEQPEAAPQCIYVKGQVVTVLRFEQDVAPLRARLVGGEGRFEPMGVVGRKVVLEPRRDLSPEEGFSLLVTLSDDREVPFLLRPPGRREHGSADQQLNVYKDRDGYEAMASALLDSEKENKALRVENERFRKEEVSEDHALAALLTTEAEAQTPFKGVERFSGKDDGAKLEGTVYRGKGKAAVVFRVKNLHAVRSWSMKSVRLVGVADARERALAVRSSASVLEPGMSGVIGLVVDGSAFLEGGTLTALRLELYRQDGLLQAFVQLDPALLGE
ncbi:DUF2381 family protein [Corallococcus carmarthensis]|uniref:DUF2381 family protein n=2 Tax=Corallococcus carmarthensis TaxID=2316728 RepID=A0A3A8JLP2_9BACT|nr:DUF2381 family protein [Corallococcus carmarthensis]RKG96657.1 DUF2381 family protein [Corallococcus carmarthensis]